MRPHLALLMDQKIDKANGMCWIWLGQRGNDGYGRWASTTAHRGVYQRFVGPIPEGLQLDHLCRNKLCVNPDHLEPVTNRENCRRRDEALGIGSAQTRCRRGHEFTPENTYIERGRNRRCRKCSAAKQRAMKARKKLAGFDAHGGAS